MNKCIMCGREMPEGGHVCTKCMDGAVQPNRFAQGIELLKANVELSFGAGNGEYDFIVGYRRAKPLNWFQRWMFKVCFGIRARNV